MLPKDIHEKESLLIAGIMSGTSLDGIDVAFVEISGEPGKPDYRLRSFHSVPYNPALREQLLKAYDGTLPSRDVFHLDKLLGDRYASAVKNGAIEAGISMATIDVVGLHGQTIYHDPQNGVTVQIGSAAVVAEELHTVVIDDFRTADIVAGGEGAPLVPFCDVMLLAHPSRNRIALNIGGIANLTWLPAGTSIENLVGFDTGPGNALIDAAMRELRGLDFDEEGKLASEGSVDQRLLLSVLSDAWFQTPPPKSTGRELFGEERGREIARRARADEIEDATVIRTLTQVTARSIIEALERFIVPCREIDEIVVSGGGAKNSTLMQALVELAPETSIITSDSLGLPGDAKEAIGFALLAWATLHGVHNNVPSVTGASGKRLLGSIRCPKVV